MSGPDRPTVPPPRRKLTPPRVPAVVTEEQAKDSEHPSDRTELVLGRLAEVETRAQQAIAELTETYERALGERDRELEVLRKGDTNLNEAVEQLRKANLNMREEMQVMIASAVTLEVSRHFVSNEEADDKIKGAGRTTQAKSLIGALLLALVSSGALTAILHSCSDAPTVAPGAVQVTKPAGSAIPGAYGSR